MTFTVNPAGDLPWVEAEYRTLMGGLGDGILTPTFTVAPTALQVRASGQDRKVRIFPGNARVQGALFRATAGTEQAPSAGFAHELELPAVASGRFRTDLVVLRYDPAKPADQRVVPMLVVGVPAASAATAATPNPARTDDGAYDLILGIVRGLGSRAVTDADIEDTRSILTSTYYRPGDNLQSQNWHSPGDEMLLSTGETLRRSAGGAWEQPIGKGALLDVIDGSFYSYTDIKHPNENYQIFPGGIRSLAVANIPNYRRPTRYSIDSYFRSGPYNNETATAWNYLARIDDPSTPGRVVGQIITDSTQERVTQQRRLITGPTPYAVEAGAHRVFLVAQQGVGTARGEIGLPSRHFRVSVWAA